MTYREHMHQARRAYLERLMRTCSTVVMAARVAGVGRQALHRMLANEGIQTPFQRRKESRTRSKLRFSWSVPRR